MDYHITNSVWWYQFLNKLIKICVIIAIAIVLIISFIFCLDQFSCFLIEAPITTLTCTKCGTGHINVVTSTSFGLARGSTVTRALDHFKYAIRGYGHMVRDCNRSQKCGFIRSCPTMGQRIYDRWVAWQGLFSYCYLQRFPEKPHLLVEGFGALVQLLYCVKLSLTKFSDGISQWQAFRMAVAG